MRTHDGVARAAQAGPDLACEHIMGGRNGCGPALASDDSLQALADRRRACCCGGVGRQGRVAA